MKKSLISFWLILLAILAASSTSGSAKPVSERYPTATEVQRLREQLRQQIRSAQNAGYARDIRNSSEKQNRESFVRAWSRVDSSVAPFLGYWVGYEESLGIYPSKTRGSVCLIYIGIQEAEFSLGTVVNGEIRTNRRQVILKEGEVLGLATVFSNETNIRGETPYHSPRVPQSAREFAQSSGTNAEEISKVVREFNAAGCMASLPSRR